MTETTAPGANGPGAGQARWRNVLGWVAVALATLVASFWAMWGAIENFHEGWHRPALWQNLALTLAYLSFMLITVALALVALRWPRIGASIMVALGVWFTWWILSGRPLTWAVVLSWVPASVLVPLAGTMFWLGRPRPKRWAYRVTVGVPLLVAVVCSAEPIWRVAGRVDDGNREARLVEGNGVRLVWAPAGPGWPGQGGVRWEEAQRICRHLSADGTAVLDRPQDVWRLPTVDEAVRSMARHGENCGGVWDPATGRADYLTKPDKESPLWDTTSPVIYWWTATEKDREQSYLIVYHGGVFAKSKRPGMGSLAFRAVKEAAD